MIKTRYTAHSPLFYKIKTEKKSVLTTNLKTEKHTLKFSIYSSLFFAVIAFIWGASINSQMLIFDGIYSSASVLMAGLSFYVAGILQKESIVKFPYGKSQLEPLILILKSLVILVVCLNGLTRSLMSLEAGSHTVNSSSAMLYCLIGFIGCLVSWLYIEIKKRKIKNSDLVKAESWQWFGDTLLSVIIFFGFLTAYLIKQLEAVNYSGYIDSLMVVISSLAFSIIPIISIIKGTKDILQMAPDENIYENSKCTIEKISKKHNFYGFTLRIAKSGRKLIYEVGLVSNNKKDERSVGELDDIRQEIEDGIKEIFDNPFNLDITFMHDEKWG